MAAACMTGADEAKVEQLPDTTGLKNEIVIFKGQRNRIGIAIKSGAGNCVALVPAGSEPNFSGMPVVSQIASSNCSALSKRGW